MATLGMPREDIKLYIRGLISPQDHHGLESAVYQHNIYQLCGMIANCYQCSLHEVDINYYSTGHSFIYRYLIILAVNALESLLCCPVCAKFSRNIIHSIMNKVPTLGRRRRRNSFLYCK